MNDSSVLAPPGRITNAPQLTLVKINTEKTIEAGWNSFGIRKVNLNEPNIKERKEERKE